MQAGHTAARFGRGIPGATRRQRVLLIGGSLNQTTMMHRIGEALGRLGPYDCWYTPFYCDGILHWLNRRGFLDFTIMGPSGRFRALTDEYFRSHQLPLDERGDLGGYDLVLTCSDLVVQRNIRGTQIVLVQEGMTDPEDWTFHLVRTLKLPRWLASTATTGLSLAYRKFCVASDGYRDLFEGKGVPRDRLVVTGIPNFDDCRQFLANDFPHRDYVMVATSDTRETFKVDLRRRFFDRVEAVAQGRPLLFKLHPNEDAARSSSEITRRFPDALIFASGNTNHMIANCRVLITQWSSTVYVGLALGKECHSYFDMDQLKRLVPWQNGGQSADNIAHVCRDLLVGQQLTSTSTARAS
jgi:hypothetical protein